MSLAQDYRRQFSFRDWKAMYSKLPLRAGERVLDLGCAIGDQARDLARRGAEVIAIDGNDELLSCAETTPHDGVTYRKADLAASLPVDEAIDGLWSSFACAYFVDLRTALQHWIAPLRPGGWIALVEVDDLFGRTPLAPRTCELLDGYADDASRSGRYDFRMGRRLATELEAAGCRVESENVFRDREFAFDGPAEPAVLAAWAARFDRMGLLASYCADEFSSVRDDYMACLAHPDHQSRCKVVMTIARKSAR